MVAAVSGYAVAGGMELALMCDLRVMEETAIMGVFCRRFGKILLCYLQYLPEYNLLVLGKCLYSHWPGFLSLRVFRVCMLSILKQNHDHSHNVIVLLQ